MRIPLAAPVIDQSEVDAVAEVLRSGKLVQGGRVAAFEARCAELVGVAHAVAVSSGTAALHLALLVANVKPGDVVAVPAYSWPATANVVVLAGAVPLFVDIDPVTFCMDPHALEIEFRRQQIFAVMPVHAFGGLADMPALCALAAEHGSLVIEDAACAIGASLDSRAAGTWGRLGCFSFHPRKTVTTGEGGLVVTESSVDAMRVRTLRNHGLDPESAVPDFVDVGFNYRLTEMQAAMGEVQLGRLHAALKVRRRQAALYHELLEGTGVTPPRSLAGSVHSYQSYVALLPPGMSGQSHDVINDLRAGGIEVSIGTYHIPLTTCFRRRGRYAEGQYPNADDVSGRAVTLPLHSAMDEAEQEEVVAALVSALRH